MATLNIGGQRVKVDDSFLRLSPEQQQATVDEIAASIGGAAQPQQQQPAGPPAGAVPGSRAYADWAAQEARAGRKLPQISDPNWTETKSDILDPLVQGITFGFGDELRGAVQGGIGALQGRDFGDTYNRTVDESRNALEHERRVNPVGSFAAELAGAIPTGYGLGGQLAARGATLGARALSGIGVGAGQGALYGAGASDGDLGDRAMGAGTGALFGGAVGLAAPYIAQGVKRVFTPAPASQSRNAAFQTLRNEGVDLTAGQRTGSKKLQYLEAELGGGAADNFTERQSRQFTAAVLRRAGINADDASPQVLDDAFTRIGGYFNRLAANTDIPFDRQLQNDMLSVVADYQEIAAAPARAIESIMNRAAQIAQQNGGVLRGQAYQNLRSKMGDWIKAADGPTRQALHDLQEALDDAVERNLSPQLREAWQAARHQYRNLLVIEKAATGAGQNTASGMISPAQLRNAAIQQNRRAFARGRNAFTDLANAGVEAMTPLPQSGTAPRLAARAVASIPAVLGALAGSPGGFAGSAAGALAGAAVPRLAGGAALSRPGRALLGNQLFSGTNSNALEELFRRSAAPVAAKLPPLEITVPYGDLTKR